MIVTYNTMQAGGPYAGRGDVNPIEQIRWTRVAVRIQPVRQAGLEVLFIISGSLDAARECLASSHEAS